MKKNDDIVQNAIEALSHAAVPQGPSDSLIEQTLKAIGQSQEAPKQKPISLMERIIQMKSISKFAAAAIIIVGISMLFLFNSAPSGIALADVYARVQQAQAFMYKMSMTMTGMGEITGHPEAMGPMEMDMTVTISTEYGMKMENQITETKSDGKTENITQLAYLLPQKNILVSIMPDQKLYQTIELSIDLLEQIKKQNNDPREMIKQMMGCEYVELEQTEMDGMKVQGFQSSDPALAGGVSEEITSTLWVDVETWMPIKYEMTMKMGKNAQAHCVINHFEWNVPVSAADFEYTIPDDYKTIGNMKMPPMNKESAIEGLRTYLKFFDKYPEKLDLVSLMTSFGNLKDETFESEFAKEFREKMEAAGPDEAKLQQFMQELMAPIQSLGMFQMKLVQEKKDPAYYGDQVTPEDTDAVLMRWKNDEGTYTVIFGDLSTVDMEYEDLVKIEPRVETTVP